MSGYLLEVRAGEKVLAQGTGWFVRPDRVVTAFHVVGHVAGKRTGRAWRHEIPADAPVTYRLRVGDREVALDPGACDVRADVALLRCETVPEATVLPVTDGLPVRGADFRAEGFPAFHNGQPFALSGQVTEVRGEVSATALQIRVAEGTGVRWEGVSGSAVVVGDRVVGVVTQVTSGASTAWAASARAIVRVGRVLGEETIAPAIAQVLVDLYPSAEDLAHLRAELGWPPDPAAGSKESAAAALAARALLDSREGADRLLEAVLHDHPEAAPRVSVLLDRVEAVESGPVRTRFFSAPPRARADRAREILQVLADPQAIGVAVVEPEGFRARAVVDEALGHLRASDQKIHSVHLVPERRPAGDEGLYTKLIRDLRWSTPDPWQRVLDDRKDASAMDRFEYGVQDLLEGPAQQAGKKLLFVVEGLDRVPGDQLEQWGYLLARLSNRGLKLLAWGGQKLHDLRTQAPSDGHFSAFHVLREVPAGELTLDEVTEVVDAAGGTEEAAEILYRETGGHPGLVEELIRDYREDALGGDREAIEARILDGELVGRLRAEVDREPGLQAALRVLAAVEGEALPRGKKRRDESRLRWMGIIKDAGAKSWAWVAPAMKAFAGEW